MAAVAHVLVNGIAGPALSAVIGATYALSNQDNTDVVSWQWTLVDRPTGSTAVITTPTAATAGLTTDREGTYIVSLVLNGTPTIISRAAIAVFTSVVSADVNKAPEALRYPGATESEEVTPVRGWTKDLNRWLELVNKDQLLPRRVAVWTTSSISGPVRISGIATTQSGDEINSVVLAQANSLATLPAVGVIEATTTPNAVSYLVTFGPTRNNAVSLPTATAGQPVYVSDAGTLSLTPGTNAQIIGYALSTTRMMVAPATPVAYHGNAGGGSQHAVATQSVAGFMSAADKVKLDGVTPAVSLTLSNANPVDVGAVPSAGIGTEVSRADHAHAHGLQTDPTMHALAGVDDGFMSAADKAKLDTVTVANIPTSTQKDALAGSSGAPSGTNPYVTSSDPRLLPPTQQNGIAALTYQPIETYTVVTDALKAKAIALRGVLTSRSTITTIPPVSAYNPGNLYTDYIFLRDYYMLAKPFPGLFTAAEMTPLLNLFFASIGGDAISPEAPAEHFDLAGNAAYRSSPFGNVGHLAIFDSAAYLTMLTGLVFRRGDHTIYETRKAAMRAALDAAPRQNGLIYSDPLDFTSGWGFEDSLHYTGGLGMASALYAMAYRELAFMADMMGDAVYASQCDIKFRELVNGLSTLRRADHLYMPTPTDSGLRHSILSALMVAQNLITDQHSRYLTAVAVRDMVSTGKAVNQYGAQRHLVYPDQYTTGIPTTAQNGDWWPGEWVYWSAAACRFAGDTALADTVMSNVVVDLVRQHTGGGDGPWEYENAVGARAGTTFSGAASTAIAYATGPFSGFYELDTALPTSDFVDSFDTDTLANYALVGGVSWSISGGAMRNNGTADGESALHDAGGYTTYYASFSSADLTSRFPCFMVSAADADNGLMVLVGSENLHIYRRVGGSNVSLFQQNGIPLTPLSNNTQYTIRIRLDGTHIEVMCIGFWANHIISATTATPDGKFGPFVSSAGTGEIAWTEIKAYTNLDLGAAPDGFVIDPGSGVPYLASDPKAGALTGTIKLYGPDGSVVDTATATGFVAVRASDPNLH